MNNILLGAYGNLERDAHEHVDSELDKVISALIRENKSSCRIREAFDRFDTDGSGELDLDEFIQAYKQLKPDITESQLVTMFAEADLDDSGTLDFDEFNQLVSMDQADVLGKLGMQNRDDQRSSSAKS
jgi:Ca2+-binding EF-hand superfamily protein